MTSPSKIQKVSSTKQTDRISNLPDSILHLILCFRDMKEVVKTSKLSRRWRSVWKFVPTLNFVFSFKDKGKVEKFVKFVDRVLLLRKEEVNIDKLSFSCCDISNIDLENWMTVAVRRHVQELYLDLKSNQVRRELPDFVFTSEIKCFKVHCEDCFLKVPKLMCVAPNLQIIELVSVRLPGSNNLKNELVINSPVLEELRLRKCYHQKLETLVILSPQLRSLVIEDPKFRSMILCKIQLSTPRLMLLVLKGGTFSNYSLGSLPSLVNAKFEVDGQLVGAGVLHKVLNSLCSVENLQLSGGSLKVGAGYISVPSLNPFSNLRHLKLRGFSDGSCVRLIHNLLTSSISLENLSLGINQISTDKDWMELYQCIAHLKFIEIDGIEGRDIELEFFKFVLKTAVSLEVFNATPHEKFSLKTKREMATFTMTIYSLPRASPSVQIFFFQ